MSTPTPRPGILDIKPYIPGSSSAPGADKIYKLSSNESALGASPKAIEAYKKAASGLHLYPDGSARMLREKIAAKYGLDAKRIVCGSGSDELLQLLTKAYAGEGDNIVQSDHGFLVYALAAKSCGAAPRFAPENNLTADIDALADCTDERTRIVFLANPNNPTGTYISGQKLRALRSRLRDDIILVIDSAYAEYMEHDDYEAGEKLVEEFDNVVMTRTFSKIYGLAALRLGWIYCPPGIADAVHRIRGPFNVNAPAIAAGASALNDDDFTRQNRDFNRAERDRIAKSLSQLGLEFVPGYGNFLLVKFPGGPGLDAKSIQEFLREHGVIVREMGPYKLGEYLRISIGEKDGNSKLIELLAQKF